MKTTKQRPIDVISDYESVPVAPNSWNDEPLDNAWLRGFQDYLVNRKGGALAWKKATDHCEPRNLLESIHRLTTYKSPEREPGSGYALVNKREVHAQLKDRFAEAEELLGKIEMLTTTDFKARVVNITSDPLDWPPERKEFQEWISAGKELLGRLKAHFKAISHASREIRNDERFLIVVFLLRYQCRCTVPEAALLIASGIAASGRKREAENFHELKLKDDLRRLQKNIPDLYRKVEEDIKGRIKRSDTTVPNSTAAATNPRIP